MLDLQQMQVKSLQAWNNQLTFIGWRKVVSNDPIKNHPSDQSRQSRSPIANRRNQECSNLSHRVSESIGNNLLIEHFSIDFYTSNLHYLCSKVAKLSSNCHKNQLTSMMISLTELMVLTQDESICFKLSNGSPPQEIERRTIANRLIGFGKGEQLGAVIGANMCCYYVGFLKFQHIIDVELRKMPKMILKDDERKRLREWEKKFEQEEEDSFFDLEQSDKDTPENSFIKTSYSRVSKQIFPIVREIFDTKTDMSKASNMPKAVQDRLLHGNNQNKSDKNSLLGATSLNSRDREPQAQRTSISQKPGRIAKGAPS
jgi:hypothetical protein